MMELKINEKFRTVAPPLSENEVRLLREDVLANGCREPLVTWNGVIVDGHHRYAICMENGIPFQIMEMAFTDEDEAMVWIAKNQLGRRNLNAFQRCELVLPLEPMLAAEAEKRMKAGISGGVGEGGRKTRDILAEMAGVSHGLLRQVKVVLNSADEETKDKVRRGEIKVYAAFKRVTHGQEKAESDQPENVVILELSNPPRESAVELVRELLRKVTYGEADPETVIMELTRILRMMEDANGKKAV